MASRALIFLCGMLGLMASMPTPCAAQFGYRFEGELYLTKENNVRLRTTKKTVTTIKVQFTYVDMLRSNGDWRWIRTYDGHEGWVRRSQLYSADDAIRQLTEWMSNRNNSHNSENLRMRGSILARMELHDLTIHDETESIRLDPNNRQAYYLRAYSRMMLGQYEQAISDANRALSVVPKKSYGQGEDSFPLDRIYRVRAACNEKLGNYRHAYDDFSKALGKEPGSWRTNNEFARFLCTCPQSTYRDGKLAVKLATKACEDRKWKVLETIDTLAAAYAETGDFDKAVEQQIRAIEMAPVALGSQRIDLARRLAFYKLKMSLSQGLAFLNSKQISAGNALPETAALSAVPELPSFEELVPDLD